MKTSFVIPAYNEQENIQTCLQTLIDALAAEKIDHEIIVINDNSQDQTESIVLDLAKKYPQIRPIHRAPPGGFGRAVRTGLEFVHGDYVIIYMSDCSDHPADAIAYIRKLDEGYDCVFGSRFIRGASAHRYPRVKLVVNRIVNHCIQWMFWTKFNDLTNAFKGFRTEVLQRCGPYRACHFNITLEISLSALISGYKICQIPVHWEGRTWGSSNLRMQEMGRRYLCTLLMLFFQRMLLSDDLRSERSREQKLGAELTVKQPQQ